MPRAVLEHNLDEGLEVGASDEAGVATGPTGCLCQAPVHRLPVLYETGQLLDDLVVQTDAHSHLGSQSMPVSMQHRMHVFPKL